MEVKNESNDQQEILTRIHFTDFLDFNYQILQWHSFYIVLLKSFCVFCVAAKKNMQNLFVILLFVELNLIRFLIDFKWTNIQQIAHVIK